MAFHFCLGPLFSQSVTALRGKQERKLSTLAIVSIAEMGVKNAELSLDDHGMFTVGDEFRAKLQFDVDRSRAPLTICQIDLQLAGW